MASYQPVMGDFNQDGSLNKLWGPNGAVAFDTSNVAITGGSIGGRPVADVAASARPSIVDYGPSNPLYVAHRGSAALYPEESSVAYARSVADRAAALETDVQTLSDGSLGLMHDSTVDRTTTGTGNVNSFNSTTFQALTMDPSVWQGSNYGDTLNPQMFQAYIDAYKGKSILMPEDKDLLSMTALVRALVNSGVAFDQALVQSFGTTGLGTAVAAGYPAIGLTAAGSPTPSAIAATGAQWAAVANGESLAPYIAAGLKTMVYTVSRRQIRDTLLAQGAAGIFSDDPVYISGNTALSTTDLFARQTWVPGMLGNGDNQGLVLPNRGLFTAPNWWGYTSLSTGYFESLMGYLCPLANPTNFSITYNVSFDSANAGDTTRWASVFISTDDRLYDNTAGTTATGYLLMMRKNGTLSIFRQDSGQAGVSIGSVTGSTIADGTELTFKITRSGSSLTIALMSGTTVLNSVTATDSAYPSTPYIHLGRNGLACKFRNVTVA
jgi:glycerophosphoryl diester phosphodiesterase